ERRRGRRVLHRNQRDDRGVHDAGDVLHGREHHAVRVGVDRIDVLRLLRRGQDLAAPAIGGRSSARSGLVHLGDRGTASAHAENDFGHLRADRVVLVRGQRDRGQNADDRNHDHQFDQGKALLQRFHWTYSFLGTPKLALGTAKSKGYADRQSISYLIVL